MKSQKIKGVEHFVYEDENEFRKHYPNTPLTSAWKTAEIGDWVKADDGGVCQVLRKRQIKHPSDSETRVWASHYIGTVVGTFLTFKKAKMDTDFSNHPNRYTFTTNKVVNSNRRAECTRQEIRFAQAYVALLPKVTTHGFTIEDVYYNAYKMAYGHMSVFVDDRKKVVQRAETLSGRPRIVSEINENIKDTAKSIGMDTEWVLQGIKDLGDNSDDDGVKLKAFL